MRIHLGHHFYGAGNLGDDFMLAGFLGAMRTLAPDTTFTACVPFPLEPLRRRFPVIEWLPCDDASRTRCIQVCDVWLGLGGSPFQSAHSRWFLDHLVGEQERCQRFGKPMYFLGVGVQQAEELADADLQRLCAGAAGIWTRDTASAERLRSLSAPPPVTAAADLAHLFFAQQPPPPSVPGRLTAVLNFDYAGWPGQADALAAMSLLPASDRVWLAQETRELPGAERALFAALPADEQARWRLVDPEIPGAPLAEALGRWPSGEWLVTARYHAAIAGAWSGSRVVVIGTNEKLRGAAGELSVPLALATQARDACAAFVRSAVAHQR